MNERDIIFLSNPEANPICRDAGKPFADSLGFDFGFRVDLKSFIDKYSLIIVDLGWSNDKIDELVDCIKISEREDKVYLRLVDDHVNLRTNEWNQRIMELILSSEILCKKIICPYSIKIFGGIDPIVIPYHYEESNEVNNHGRLNKALLSGYDHEIYPLRRYLYDNITDPLLKDIEVLSHPGYTGKRWPTGKLGNDFITELSKYKVAITTTSCDYELMKYVESAQAGCAPLGEFPTSILYHILNQGEFYKLRICNILMRSKSHIKQSLDLVLKDYIELSTLWRGLMKSIRNKSKILNMYENL